MSPPFCQFGIAAFFVLLSAMITGSGLKADQNGIFGTIHSPPASAAEFSVPPGASRTIYIPVNQDWRSATGMTVSVTTNTANTEGSFGAILVDKNGFWFRSKREAGIASSQTSFSLSLQGPQDWNSTRDQRRPFARDVLRWVRRWGVKITNYSKSQPLTGTVAIALEKDDLALDGPSTLRYPSPGVAGQVTEFTVEYLPFVPGVDSHLTLDWQSGDVSGSAAFFPLQRFTRVSPPFGEARLSPLERSVWAARWVPPKAGTYALQLKLNGSPYGAAAPLRTFDVVASGSEATRISTNTATKAFVRANERVQRAWQDGGWRNTPAIPAYWHAQLEWTAEWGSYLGAGEYNQRIAWSFEQEIANHVGQAMPILLFSDDELDNEGTFNWPENPLNVANGGPLTSPAEFYRSFSSRSLGNEAAMRSILARARYLINRYQSFPAVNGLLIDMRHPATFGDRWASTFARRLQVEYPETPIYFSTPLSKTRRWSSQLSLGGGWRQSASLQSTTTTVRASTNGNVRVSTAAEGVAAVIATRVEHLAHASALSFSILPQENHRNSLQVMVLLKSEDGKICQSPLMRLTAEFGHTFEVPLDDLSYWRDKDGKPALADRRELAAMEEVAFRFFCDGAPKIGLEIANLRLHGPHATDKNPPLLGPFDAPYRDDLFVAKGNAWREVAEPPRSCWNPVLDWPKTKRGIVGYGKVFDDGIATEFGRVLDAHSGSPKPLLIFSEDELDDDSLYNWADHPLNAGNGGPLARKQDFYRDRSAMDAVTARARYILKRYGDSPAINGLLIDLRYRHAGSDAWVSRLTARLSKEFPDIQVYCNDPRLQKRAWWYPIRLATGWKEAPSLCVSSPKHSSPSALVRQHPVPASTRTQKRPIGAASLVTQGMTSAAIANSYVQHWANASQFSCTVTPSANCRDVRMTAMIRTDDGRLFESPLIQTYGSFPHRITFPLDDTEYWTPRGGSRKLIPALDLLNVHQVVLRFFNLPPDRAEIAIANTSLLGIRKTDLTKRPEFGISSLTGTDGHCKQYQRYELDFQLNRTFRNPYDPEEIAVDLYLTDPDGKKLSHPAFYWEDWSVALNDGIERVIKGQRSAWKVRLTPQKVGTYKWTLVARHGKQSTEQTGSFQCTLGDGKGFVVVSKKDPRYFEFSNGDFYYPIGHNLRSPSDRREGAYSPDVMENCTWAEQAGTYAFEAWFKKMAANGENFARIWTTAWWMGLEWSPEHPGYHGLGFYNQANAQRLDRILQLAEAHGIYLNLELSNHGAISSKVDTEWALNPLNRKQPGGFLRGPAETLTHPRAKQFLKQRLRYVAARWGHSPAIALWGTVTEAEWADGYNIDQRGYANWLNDYGALMQDLNAAHPQAVTSHFSYPARAGDIWAKKHVQVTHTNAYDTMRDTGWQGDLFDRGHGIADRIFVFGKGLETFEQPLLIGEWGGNHLENETSHLYAELHTGLWASYMTNASGASGFWWWNLVDHKDLYGRFNALATFAQGEDRRGKEYRSLRGRVATDTSRTRINEKGVAPQAIMLYNRSEFFAYVYTSGVNRFKTSTYTSSRTDKQLPLIEKSALTLPKSLRSGSYRLEYWDTYSGTIIRTETIDLEEGKRAIQLLPFSTDLAIKLKPIK